MAGYDTPFKDACATPSAAKFLPALSESLTTGQVDSAQALDSHGGKLPEIPVQTLYFGPGTAQDHQTKLTPGSERS